MISRVVLLKLNEAAMPEQREFAAVCQRFLSALPMVREARVGLPADAASAASWDIALHVSFDDHAALDAYLADEPHRAFVASEILPRSVVRKAWNFALL